MKVRDLISILEKCNQDYDVRLYELSECVSIVLEEDDIDTDLLGVVDINFEGTLIC